MKLGSTTALATCKLRCFVRYHNHEHAQQNVYVFLCPVQGAYALLYLLDVVSAFSSSGTWEVLLSAFPWCLSLASEFTCRLMFKIKNEDSNCVAFGKNLGYQKLHPKSNRSLQRPQRFFLLGLTALTTYPSPPVAESKGIVKVCPASLQ